MARGLSTVRRLWNDLAIRLGLDRFGPLRPAPGLVAAVVRIDREDLQTAVIDESAERRILDRLQRQLSSGAGGAGGGAGGLGAGASGAAGRFDHAHWSAESIEWYFSGTDAHRLEAALAAALRLEPMCRGAWLRVTRHGLDGPWRVTRI